MLEFYCTLAFSIALKENFIWYCFSLLFAGGDIFFKENNEAKTEFTITNYFVRFHKNYILIYYQGIGLIKFVCGYFLIFFFLVLPFKPLYYIFCIVIIFYIFFILFYIFFIYFLICFIYILYLYFLYFLG